MHMYRRYRYDKPLSLVHKDKYHCNKAYLLAVFKLRPLLANCQQFERYKNKDNMIKGVAKFPKLCAHGKRKGLSLVSSFRSHYQHSNYGSDLMSLFYYRFSTQQCMPLSPISRGQLYSWPLSWLTNCKCLFCSVFLFSSYVINIVILIAWNYVPRPSFNVISCVYKMVKPRFIYLLYEYFVGIWTIASANIFQNLARAVKVFEHHELPNFGQSPILNVSDAFYILITWRPSHVGRSCI